MPGAKQVNDVPEELAGVYVTVVFAAIMLVAVRQANDALKGGTDYPLGESSSERGAVGAVTFMAMVAGGILAYTTLKEELPRYQWLPFYRGPSEKEVEPRVFDRSKYIDGNQNYPSPGELGRTDEWYQEEETQKQNYWEPNVSTVGMAKLVMSGKSHFRFGKDEYEKDHDYSRDKFREGEEEERAYNARKMSEYLEYERKRKESERQKQQQQQQMAYFPPPQMQPYPMMQYQQQPQMMFQQQAPIQQRQEKIEDSPRIRPATQEPSYVGFYGLVLFLAIITWVSILEHMRKTFFVGSDGKVRKPTQEEGIYIEMTRAVGSVLLGFLTFFFVMNFIQSVPGISAPLIAFIFAIVVAGGSYYASSKLVTVYAKVDEIPRQCLKFDIAGYKNDSDYLEYKKETKAVCEMKNTRIDPSTVQEWMWENLTFYLPFVTSIGIFCVVSVLGAAKVQASMKNPPLIKPIIPALAVCAISLITGVVIIGTGRNPYFWRDTEEKAAERRQNALNRLTKKFTTDCPAQCTKLCQQTLRLLIQDAGKDCKF